MTTPASNNRPDLPQTTLLILRARERDEEALAELLDRYLPRIHEWVRKNTGPAIRSRFETVDCVQDVVLELLRYLPTVKIDDAEVFRKILYRMIQNSLRGKHEYLMACRRRMTQEQPLPSDTILNLELVSDEPTPSDAAEASERAAWLRLGIPLLAPAHQEVILKHKLEERSFVAIAEELGESPDAVRMRFNRAMVLLSALVGRLRRGEVREVVEMVDMPEAGH